MSKGRTQLIVLLAIAVFGFWGVMMTTSPDVAAQFEGAERIASVPDGSVMFFNLHDCPDGWFPFLEADGRYVVGVNPGGTLLAEVGTALSDLEGRAAGDHSHTVTDNGHTHSATADPHTHPAFQPPHAHSVNDVAVGLLPGTIPAGIGRTESSDRTTSGETPIIIVSPVTASVSLSLSDANVTVDALGETAGTNAPYVQLLACEKAAVGDPRL